MYLKKFKIMSSMKCVVYWINMENFIKSFDIFQGRWTNGSSHLMDTVNFASQCLRIPNKLLSSNPPPSCSSSRKGRIVFKIASSLLAYLLHSRRRDSRFFPQQRSHVTVNFRPYLLLAYVSFFLLLFHIGA